ncbi:MAG: hypothetical protein AB7S38_19340 [Vulcanimicrobiota bacterium]
MKKRGLSLILVMQLAVVYLTFFLTLHIYTGQARSTVEAHKRAQAAEVMAESGLAYARKMLTTGRWTTARQFVSPRLAPGQGFTVEAIPLGGKRWRLTCVGEAGSTHCQREANWP